MGLQKEERVLIPEALKNHTDLLNFIAGKVKAKYYFEIGVQHPARNFDRINVEHKIGVDPEVSRYDIIRTTSDNYFKESGDKFDLIFIDGLHEAEQVKRDIINSWDCLTEKGVILIHDCNPELEKHSLIPRQSVIWTGNVYKTICQIASPKFTVDFDYGCCILKKGDGLRWNDLEVTWEYFNTRRKELLNLMSIEEAIKIL
jgi:hypothetical protein